MRGGVEFVISARASVAFDFTLEEAEDYLQTAVSEVVEAIMDGRLQ